MNLPQRLKLMGHEYRVIENNRTRQGSGTPGMCCPNLLEIQIEKEALESKKAEAFLHEIIEALKYHMDLKIEHRDLFALSEGLFAVIRDNDLDFTKKEVYGIAS